MQPVNLTKLNGTDAFVVVDLPDAEHASGIVRCARKILTDGATNLARATTYAYAAFEIARSGASAGINADGDARDAAVRTFVDEVAPQIAAGSLTLAPGKGVTAADLAPWGVEPAPATDDALAAGVVAAAGACTTLDGATALVEAGAPGAEAIAAGLAASGADAEVAPLADLLERSPRVAVVGAKVGALDHENVGNLGSAVIVGAAPLAITARGLAVARRSGAVVPADFVTSAGPLLAAHGEPDPAARIAQVVAAALDHAEGPYIGACEAAEQFLLTWTPELPFGRPMA